MTVSCSLVVMQVTTSASLYDMHSGERKRKREEEAEKNKDEPLERRPFDRDIDLGVSVA